MMLGQNRKIFSRGPDSEASGASSWAAPSPFIKIWLSSTSGVAAARALALRRVCLVDIMYASVLYLSVNDDVCGVDVFGRLNQRER
jgi:hypothetical protein